MVKKHHLVGLFLMASLVSVMALPAWAVSREGREAYLMRDYASAMKAFQDEGSADSLYMVGLMYDRGEGVQEDKKEAAQWFRKAAELGDVRAQYRLGQMYQYGYGVEQDNKEAAKWYRKAAGQGFESARNALKSLGE
jgi:TPR repeat protein